MSAAVVYPAWTRSSYVNEKYPRKCKERKRVKSGSDGKEGAVNAPPDSGVGAVLELGATCMGWLSPMALGF